MKLLLINVLLITSIFVSCSENKSESTNDKENEQKVFSSDAHTAMVLEKIDASSYSYLKVSENDKEYWIAVPVMDIKGGEKIFFSQSMEMKNFKSESLNRTFESVLFVQDARKSENPEAVKNAHSNLSSIPKINAKIEPLSDGYTIAQIFSEKDQLAGKPVKVKGKVIKFNEQIMNRNWVHLQDGTEDNGNYDLVITSADAVKVGDIIVAEGTLTKDKNFGAGYIFSVLIEEAKLSKQ